MGTVRLALILLALAAPAWAETRPGDYRAFGERPGLVRLMDRFMEGLLAEPVTAPFFQRNQRRIKEQLVDQFCALLEGPCEYKGGTMDVVHKRWRIDRAQFNALVEVLQDSMTAEGIPFAAQNRLLAELAPMHRDIVTR